MANEKDRKYWFLTYYKLRCLENGKVPENSNELKQIINFALQYEKNISNNRAVEYLDNKSRTYWKPNLQVYPAKSIVASPTPEIYTPVWPEAIEISGTPCIVGETWNDVGPMSRKIRHHDCIVFDNKMWIIGGYANFGYNIKITYSTNGIVWEEAGTNSLPSQTYGVRVSHRSLSYHGSMWIIGGSTDAGPVRHVLYSSNGISWACTSTTALPIAITEHTCLVYDDKMWAIGGGGSRKVFYSTDGLVWTEAGNNAIPTSYDLYGHTSVVFDNKMWIIGGACEGNASPRVFYSSDGANWTEAGTNTLEATNAVSRHTSVVFDSRMWTIGDIGGNTGRKVYYSYDGETWTEAGVDALPADGIYVVYDHASVVYDNKIWVIGGVSSRPDVSRILYSECE